MVALAEHRPGILHQQIQLMRLPDIPTLSGTENHRALRRGQLTGQRKIKQFARIVRYRTIFQGSVIFYDRSRRWVCPKWRQHVAQGRIYFVLGHAKVVAKNLQSNRNLHHFGSSRKRKSEQDLSFENTVGLNTSPFGNGTGGIP